MHVAENLTPTIVPQFKKFIIMMTMETCAPDAKANAAGFVTGVFYLSIGWTLIIERILK